MPNFQEVFALHDAQRSLGTDWVSIESALNVTLADNNKSVFQALRGEGDTQQIVYSSFRSAISQCSVVSFIEQKMQAHNLSESNKNLIRDKYMPHWLSHPMAASAYFARVRGLGLTMTDDDIRVSLHMTKDTQSLTLFDVLTASLKHVESIPIDNGAPDSVVKPIIRQIDTDETYILLASALAPLFTPPNSQGVLSRKLSFIFPQLAFLDPHDTPRKVVLNSFPPVVSKRGYTDRRAEVLRNIPYLEVFDAFGRSTRAALEDADDPRHDAARAICMLNEKLNLTLFRERLLQQVITEEYTHNRSSTEFMKAMTQNAENTEDEWYMGFVNDLRSMLPDGERHRDYTIDEFIESFRILRTQTFRDDEPHSSVFNRLRTAQQDAIGLLQSEPPFLYAYALKGNELTQFGLHSGIEQITLTEYEKDITESISRFQMSVHFAVETQKYSKSNTFWIIEDEYGMFVRVDSIDREFTFDPNLDAQVIDVFAVLLQHAVAERRAMVALASEKDSGSVQPIRIAASSTKGEARHAAKSTKRKSLPQQSEDIRSKSQTAVQTSESETGGIRLLPLTVDWARVNPSDVVGFKRASSRYQAGYRGIKRIKGYDGPSGGALYELRSRDTRYMFERKGTTLEFIASTQRKELDRWLSVYGTPR